MRHFLVLSAILAVLFVWNGRSGPTKADQPAAQVEQSQPINATPNLCEFSEPGASFSIPYVTQARDLNTDPQSPT